MPPRLIDGTILVSGEVARTSDFETGFIHGPARRRLGARPADPGRPVRHVNVRARGWSSSPVRTPIINIIRHAQAIAGADTSTRWWAAD
jgi:hypothetical protein